ncbi:TonB-dependent receptor, partial [Salmonella enterica subsp. enterica serovar Typhimurium]|uniref:TonB-dependent receptor domain-containing protein n=2 Tax=Pseudomonadota TaxID=1224 RepID=UPI0020A34BBB
STARENSIGTLLRDDFRIKTDALSGYVQNTFYVGNWSLTPGVRYEQYRQTFSASTEDFNPVNARLSDKNDKVLPGFGVTWFGI